MKIKDIKFPAGLGCIQEFCDGRFVGTHEIWDLIPDEKNRICFSFTGGKEIFTYIDIESDVRIISGGIGTVDTNGNPIELYFYRWTPVNIE